MSDIEKRIAGLSPEKRKLLEKKMRQKKALDARAEDSRIAVIGMGCRFPGDVENPQAYWKLLSEGVDAICKVPEDRWNPSELDRLGLGPAEENALQWGGFIRHVDAFDPGFFNLSPNEAEQMDPQQRLLLMVAWEALEASGQRADRLAGSSTGVFVGVHSQSSDYYHRQIADLPAIEMYTSTGGAHSIIANRLSYFFDFNGPSMVVDTACSSSLVALHLGCQSLKNKECDVALVGGCNLILSPEVSVAFSKLQFLSPAGRCKTFDESADGFVRGEGCGVVVLKRLDDAVRNNDPVLAVVRGSAVNQDGASNGITAPSGPAQEAVIRQALRSSKVDPHQISYIETHGTGTKLGDPIEYDALSSVLGALTDQGLPCYLGAVKSQIGHLEGAAGIASLIKVVLCLQHGLIPGNLHFHRLNRHIDPRGSRLTVPSSNQEWRDAEKARFAGVSSFGFGGTNAHIILQSAPVQTERKPESNQVMAGETGDAMMLPLSARSSGALAETKRQWRAFLASEGAKSQNIYDICYTAGVRRSHHEHRFAVIGASADEMAQHLATDENARQSDDRRTVGRGNQSAAGLVFVFSGQGPQWHGMGLQLMAKEKVFREAIEQCDALLRRYADWSLIDEMRAGKDRSRMDHTEIAQPAIFALQVGLADLWRSWGIAPDGVVGHSIGEVAAAYAAGVLDLEDAVRVVYHRGRLLQRATGFGKMAAAEISPDEAAGIVSRHGGRLSVGAINSPTSVTLSGEPDALLEVLAALSERDVFCRQLQVNYAFHSPQIGSYQEEMRASVEGIRPKPALVPIISTVTGKPAVEQDYGAAYWAENIRRTVQFAAATRTIIRQGCRTFLEIGPHPVLAMPISQCLEAEGESGRALASLKRNMADRQSLLASLGMLYEEGRTVAWEAVYGRPGRFTSLPGYPWQTKSYWVRQDKAGRQADIPGSHRIREKMRASSLIGARLSSPIPTFESRLSLGSLPFISDHRIHGAVIVPGAVYLATALAAAEETMGQGIYTLADVTLPEAFMISAEEEYAVQTILSPRGERKYQFQIYSTGTSGEENWSLHASGSILGDSASVSMNPPKNEPMDIEPLKIEPEAELNLQEFYENFKLRGLDFGPEIQGVQRFWKKDGQALGKIGLPEPRLTGTTEHHPDPALLDACFQVLIGLLPHKDSRDGTIVMSGIDRFKLYAPPGHALWCHATLKADRESAGRHWHGAVKILNENGVLVGEGQGLSLRQVAGDIWRRTGGDKLERWAYRPVWIRKDHPDDEPYRAARRFPSTTAITSALSSKLEALHAKTGQNRFQHLHPLLEELSVAYVVQAFRQVGFDFRSSIGQGFDDLTQRLGIAENHFRLFRRLLEILTEAAYLIEDASGWRGKGEPATIDVEEQFEQLLDQFPECETELTLAARCGAQLAPVLQGRVDPLLFIFPQDDTISAERLYTDSSFVGIGNGLIEQILTTVIQPAAPEDKLRLLEIGAGTGGTTTHLLPRLPADQTEYVFTDISPFFTTAGKEKFNQYPFVDYRLLNIEDDPVEQGFGGRKFDIIIASNVIHATQDLGRSLAHVRRLLAPGGYFIMLEVTAPQCWIDIIFGMTEGWWRFIDNDIRGSHPLLSPADWLQLLQQQGYEAVAAIPGRKESNASKLTAILARAPFTQGDDDPAQSEEQGRQAPWVIFADRKGVGTRLARYAEEQGRMPVTVYAGEQFEKHDQSTYHLNPALIEDYHRLWQEIQSSTEGEPECVVHLWSLDAKPNEETTEETLSEDLALSCQSGLHLAQSIVGDPALYPTKLVLATRGCQVVGDEAPPISPVQRPLWGLARVATLEHPELNIHMIDVDPQAADRLAALQIGREILSPDGEDQVTFRADERHVHRLIRETSFNSTVARIQPDRSYLITGGMGGLGLIVAKWLVEKGASHLTLTGRRKLPDRSSWDSVASDSDDHRRITAIKEIEALGGKIDLEYVDVNNYSAMASMMDKFGNQSPELSGVFHCAAVVKLGPLKDMDAHDFNDALAAKISGSWILHQLTSELDLDYFILFSSVTSLIGSTSMSSYVAGNQFLDAMADYRRQTGRPAISVCWGTWESMRQFSAEEKNNIARIGLNPMPADRALTVFETMLAADASPVVIASIDWDLLKPVYESKRSMPFLSQVEALEETDISRMEQYSDDITSKLADAEPEEGMDLLREFIHDQVCQVLGMDPNDFLEMDRGFFEMGMDSLTSVELKKRLDASFNYAFPTSLVFNYPNIEQLADYIAETVLESEEKNDQNDRSDSNILENGDEGDMDDQYSEEELVNLLAEKLNLGPDHK